MTATSTASTAGDDKTAADGGRKECEHGMARAREEECYHLTNLIRDCLDEAGHLVGNHSQDHRAPRWPAPWVYWREVARCQAAIGRAGGGRPAWYRPPLGRLAPAELLAARAHGLRVMTWSLDANDWRCRSVDDALACAAAVVRAARPGDVVLFHDGHPWIGTILDGVLPGLRAKGLV